MLLRFEVSNYRSLRDKQEFSLVAEKLNGPPTNLFRVGRLQVLPVAAVYGANASGKTSLLKAIRFFSSAVASSQTQWKPDGGIPIEQFAFGTKSDPEKSTFEMDFVHDGVRHTYGFEITREKVLAEWLYVFPKGRRQEWFVRKNDNIQFGRFLHGQLRSIWELTRSNSLFLSAAAQNNHRRLKPLYDWLANKIIFLEGPRFDHAINSMERCADESSRKILVRLLKQADLGVTGMDFERERLPEEVRSFFSSAAKSLGRTAELPKQLAKVRLRHRVAHTKEGIPLEIGAESAGTIAWLALLPPVLDVVNFGGVLLVDELDASLHPLLARQVLSSFSHRSNTKSAQLIFNTHDTNLLDPEILRRDQIWFVEKDKSGASHSYALTDFKPRQMENLAKGYLQGRYGAIPFLQSKTLGQSS
jgi:AAA15 family ATPase/GTPase